MLTLILLFINWQYYSLLHVWSGIWSVAATRIGFWTWIKSIEILWLRAESGYWFHWWKNSTGFIWPNNSGANMLRLTFSFSWIGVLSLYLLLKLPSRKLGPWFVLWSFFFLRLLFILINMPSCMECCSYVWVGAPSCYLQLLDCYKNRYVGLLVLPVLPVLNP